MGNKKFSVLMSVYALERPEYLDRALQSVINQTSVPDQVIIVKDGPLTKELNDVIASYSANDSRFTIIQNKKNIGLARSLNVGLENATNELVARMDSDDISVGTRFETQLEFFERMPNLVLVGGQVSEFSSDESVVIGKRTVPTKSRDIAKFVRFRSPFNHPTVMYKKSVVQGSGGYQSIDHLEDYALWGKLIAANYEMVNSEKVLVKMRVGSGLYSRRGGFNYLKGYIKLKHQFRDLGIIGYHEMLVSDFLMFINVIVPVTVRRQVYTSILHRDKA